MGCSTKQALASVARSLDDLENTIKGLEGDRGQDSRYMSLIDYIVIVLAIAVVYLFLS